MKKQICIIVLLLTCRICDAQNLVPNGGFEQYSACPTGLSGLYLAAPWFNPSLATPDYFNQCTSISLVDVPNNVFGYQPAHSGNAYSGLIQWQFGSPWREYIEVPLLAPLSIGTCYHFEMYVNSANNVQYLSDAIGTYFSAIPISNVNTTYNLQFTPQINNASGNYPDTINWIPIIGSYVANGGENYLIIGNFKDDANTNTMNLNVNGGSFAYIYIDDVSLSPCTGIDEQNINSEIRIYPNPFSDKINITIRRNELVEANFFDVTGRKILSQSFVNSTSINAEQLAKGLYLYEVRNKNGVIKKGKVIHR